MRNIIKSAFFSSIAIASGLVVLVGYIFQVFNGLRIAILSWAVILTAVILVIGVINLIRVHWRKVRTRQSDFALSLTLLISLFITLIVGVFLGPTSRWSMWIFNNIHIPIESSLMAILAVILAYTGARLFKRRLDVFTLIFIGTVVIVLIGTITLPGFNQPLLQDFKTAITQIFAFGGARGILLGVGLGTLATGLRILVGVDRPYGK